MKKSSKVLLLIGGGLLLIGASCPSGGPIKIPCVVTADGKLVCETIPASPSPTEEPPASPSPETPASPSPSTPPTPPASPSPSTPPSTPPSPPPSEDKACELQPDGMYPLPPEGTCPACWRAQPDLISYWGIAFMSKTQCERNNPKCPYGIKVNVHLTPHSPKRFLRHRLGQPDGGGSDTLFACQPCGDPSNPECRAAIPQIWVYPPGGEPGLCDPFSGSLYWCHHKPQAGQEGPTKFEVRAPPFRSVIVNVP